MSKPRPELAAQAQSWLGAIRVASHAYPEAEAVLLSGSEHFFAPAADMSPNERRLAIDHIVNLYRARNKPEQAASWQKRLASLHSKKPNASDASIELSKLSTTRVLILDTDHVSALAFPSQVGLRLLERIDTSGEVPATTIITVEEQLRGWLSEIHRLSDPHQQVLAYEHLQQRIDFFASWTVLPWNADAADVFVRFRCDHVRIGSMDLKIACITLAHGAMLLTRNVADFSKVTGLRCENGSHKKPGDPLCNGMPCHP